MSAIDHWDWIRYALGIGLLLCNVGVWRGVALEESFVDWDKETGKRLLVRSLALEAFFAAALFVVDTYAGIQQKREITALNAEVAPRRLSRVQQSDISGQLSDFSGKSVFMASYVLDTESAVLLFQVRDALEKAKLSVNPKGILSVAGEGGLVQLGIHITGRNTELVARLLKVIGKYEVVSSDEPFPRGFISYGSLADAANADATIFIGVKPIILTAEQ